ncbi:enoyl-CoA hydratase/isomerase family protein [Terasakiella pusilla]|uniref:enoyl-CoA hydratase/isomerase family protein n=1 Tax=Terasakiella pusilla TaxID=64973 RepID=UPI003AA7DF6D
MSFKTLSYQVEGGVAEIMLTRPEEANTLNAQMVLDLKAVVEKIEQDHSVRAILLCAAPGPFFCAGGDLVSFAKAGDQLPDFARHMLVDFHPTMQKLFSMNAPLVTAVNGAVAGIGCSFVLGSSLSLFAEDANFTMAYTGAGLSPDGGATYFLPRIVGLRAAEELILTNRTLSAQEAVEWGIANQMVPADQLLTAARATAYKIANGPTLAFGNVRQLLLNSLSSDLATQLDREAESFAEMAGTQDCREGITAFLQKRKPDFIGR